jgi:RimJ/RimL family protein N-acetyltransferase
MDTLETARLSLLPYGPAQLLALIEGIAPFEAAMGARAAPGLRDGITSSEVSPDWLARLRDTRDADVWLHGFGVFHRESGSVIGSAGFKGPPDTIGVVEIAYGIVPVFQSRGYATEATAALVDFAIATGRVTTVRAHTLPTNTASTRVLEKCGFRYVGPHMDPEDGLVSRWERTVS